MRESQNLNLSEGRSPHLSSSEPGDEPDASGREIEAWIIRPELTPQGRCAAEPQQEVESQGQRGGRCRGMAGLGRG